MRLTGPPDLPGFAGVAGLPGFYRAQLKLSLAEQLQYRGSAFIWLMFGILHPVVSVAVWSAVAGAQGGSVGGFDAQGFAGYFLVQVWVSQAIFTYVMFIFERRVRLGELSPRLLRPVHPIHADVAENLMHKLVQLIVLVPATVVLVLLFRPSLTPAEPLMPQPWATLAGVPAVLLAFVLCFAVEWTVALAGFWTTRVAAINEVYLAVYYFTAGQFAPLSLLPGWAQGVAGVLPFRWMLAFPTELLLGRVSPAGFLQGIAAQGAWIAVAVAVLVLTWRAGVKRYSAVGA